MKLSQIILTLRLDCMCALNVRKITFGRLNIGIQSIENRALKARRKLRNPEFHWIPRIPYDSIRFSKGKARNLGILWKLRKSVGFQDSIPNIILVEEMIEDESRT